ncbi:MAG TPA: SDR family oxidoreductase [Candidatus Paceibacterota bacterium]|nr:SDR family oxidoreductase [Candidatus Paceibacterota bacterium]
MAGRRTAIISGGCGGVGQVVGRKLAEDGFDVVLFYRSTLPDKAAAIIQGFAPGNHAALKCDLLDEQSVGGAIKSITESHGGIYACIHAAVDPVVRKNVLEMESAEVANQLAVAFWGGLHLFKQTAPVMQHQGEGVIVGILSRVVEPGSRYSRMAGTTIAKYALRGLLKEFDGDLTPFRVSVNGIAPDFMDTPLNRDLPPEVRRFIAERAASGSIKTPEDVALAVSFLCSPAGKDIHGKVFSFEERELSSL